MDVTFLSAQTTEANQKAQVLKVAQKLGDFIKAATHNLHVAIYDFRLSDDPAEIVIGALNDRAETGVVVRVAYFAPKKSRKSTKDFAAVGADPAPGPEPHFLNRLSAKVLKKGIQELGPNVEKEAINGMSHLMHDKYVVRDGMTPQAALWTGSTNFTDDAFSLQENNIVVLESQDLCEFYETDFAEMWSQESIKSTGKNDRGSATVDGADVSVAFSPGEGRTIDHEIASSIAASRQEVKIASMVISSGGVLSALAEAIDRGVEVSGIYDGTEMEGVEKDWGKGGDASASKLNLWNAVKEKLVAKYSHPYTDDGPHDFMHNKFVVIDESKVITGSFNFSNNATRNAENVLFIGDAEIAGKYAAFANKMIETYRGSTKPFSGDEVSNPHAAEVFAAEHPVTKAKKRRRK
ncbi:MAG TPA: phosphatidylserine/phosphatidylglycerophosphate/cardiolipin synthase family protein [Methylocystis sp.]|nr:phosphatidylserine/phosphatidylglycerophosphate/cardiolipin synthase family protein [Methylocystis sp.]